MDSFHPDLDWRFKMREPETNLERALVGSLKYSFRAVQEARDSQEMFVTVTTLKTCLLGLIEELNNDFGLEYAQYLKEYFND